MGWDEQTCNYYDSLHAAGLCLGTIQARTHVQLALACQRIGSDAASLPKIGGCVHHWVHRVSCASHAHVSVLLVFLLSAFFFPLGHLFPGTSDGQPFFIRIYRTES